VFVSRRENELVFIRLRVIFQRIALKRCKSCNTRSDDVARGTRGSGCRQQGLVGRGECVAAAGGNSGSRSIRSSQVEPELVSVVFHA
jgi:hypothetical protein